jgi:hypothetical protein
MNMTKMINNAAISVVVATSAVAGVASAQQMTPTKRANSSQAPSQAASAAMSMGLHASFYGSAAIVAGTSAVAAGASKFVVASVKTVGEATVLVLRSVGEAGSEIVQLSLRMGEKALLAAGIAIGGTINLIATSVGWAVRTNGETIGFALNEHGRELMRQEKIGG